jgi:hypothetical protein
MVTITSRPLYSLGNSPGWVSPRTGLEEVERRKILPPTGTQNSDPSFVQLVANGYVNCATPALFVT